MSVGKLYRLSEEQFVADVRYQIYEKTPNNLWGELTLNESRSILNGGGYVIELEDDCKYQCNLRKIVNRAVNGVPPRYVYRFSGNMPVSPSP
jgi:hypothetical protein